MLGNSYRTDVLLRLTMAVSLLATTRFAMAADTKNFPTPLPGESIPKVMTLPAHYPKGWSFLAYANDKMELRNVGSDRGEIKGQLAAHESATLLVSTQRPEVYVADTVWSRGNRGVRTDYITAYDKQTLNPIGEIVLPGAKRALVVPMQGMFSFTDQERMALVFNFTPASSVTVVDLLRRKVLSEVPIPGCSLAYPTGTRGFSTLCGGGTLLSIRLNDKGAVSGRLESKAFNPLDTDPLFTNSALIAGVRYFPSLLGRVQPIDMRGEEASILPDWPLVSQEDAAMHWRPSGLQLIAGGDDGRLYVIMQPEGHEGSHKEPGTEVWIFDPATHSRIKRIRLVRPGTSLEVTHDREPLLLVAVAERLDVYELPGGSLVRSIGTSASRGGVLLEAVR
jgi:methylamine dehydrogenase heavy chain